MDNSQVLIALLGSITSIITAVIAGYYAVRVSQLEQKRLRNKPQSKDKEINRNTFVSSRSVHKFILVLSIIPIAFTLALLGDWISGTPNKFLIPDALDSAVISPLFFLISYLISTRLFLEKTNIRRIIFPSIIIAVLIMPLIYLLGLFLNLVLNPGLLDLHLTIYQNQIINISINWGAPLDAMICGGVAVIAGFLLGASKKNIILSLE